jgi:hypothetical protein
MIQNIVELGAFMFDWAVMMGVLFLVAWVQR